MLVRRTIPFFIFFIVLFIQGWTQGSYYANISTSSPTFITDLQNRIRTPYNRISYDSYDETILANYESWQYSSTQRAVQCVYSGEVYPYTPPFAWGHFSREHTWCQSWMPVSSGDQYSDQHHLFPVNQNNANGIRSNHPLGIVTTLTSTYLESKYGKDSSGYNVYEPRNIHKGDAARSLLYMALRYNGVSGMDWTFSNLSSYLVSAGEGPQSVATLIKWHEQDPPDKWEVDRNTYIQSTQLNRNPFIDHPEYVNYINFWNMTSLNPGYESEPSNSLTNLTTGSVNNTFIQLTWNDSTGSPSPAGYMFLAYDTDNYFIPEDGITYAEDSNFSDGKGIVHVNFISPGTVNSYIFSDLNPNTKYYFRVYAYTGSSSSTNYKIDGIIPAIVTTTITGVLATEPTNYPTGFTISSISTHSIQLNWINSTGAQLPSGYILIGNNSGSFSNPLDALIYANDTDLGDGNAKADISYSSANTTFTFTNLTSNQTYYFRIYPYNGSGAQRNYKTDSTVPSVSGTTLQEPSIASLLTLDPTTITENTSLGNGFLNYLGYPISTSHGFVWDTNTNPTIALTTRVDNGAPSTTGFFTGSIGGLSPQTLYYIRAYATNTVGTAYGDEIQFYTLSPEPSAHVSSFTVTSVSQTQINLSWTTTLGATGYMLLQKQGSNLTGTPFDGILYSVGDNIGDAIVTAFLGSGTTNTQSVTGLSAGTQYSFSIFPFNYNGVNEATYNFRTTGTIPSTTTTTLSLTGPPVIINEFSQGSSGAKEWVEILVVQNNFNLQNYTLIDGNGTLSITLSGSGFASIAQGSLIVIYNGGDVDPIITPDLSYNGGSDRNLIISSLNNTGSFALTRTTGWNGITGAFANASNTDIPQLISSSGDTVFAFPRIPTPGGGSFTAYLGNTASGATIGSNWSADSSYNTATPGQPNGGNNTTWINSLINLAVELWDFYTQPTERENRYYLNQ